MKFIASILVFASQVFASQQPTTRDIAIASELVSQKIFKALASYEAFAKQGTSHVVEVEGILRCSVGYDPQSNYTCLMLKGAWKTSTESNITGQGYFSLVRQTDGEKLFKALDMRDEYSRRVGVGEDFATEVSLIKKLKYCSSDLIKTAFESEYLEIESYGSTRIYYPAVVHNNVSASLWECR